MDTMAGPATLDRPLLNFDNARDFPGNGAAVIAQ
jgi:hypothetical protein